MNNRSTSEINSNKIHSFERKLYAKDPGFVGQCYTSPFPSAAKVISGRLSDRVQCFGTKHSVQEKALLASVVRHIFEFAATPTIGLGCQ